MGFRFLPYGSLTSHGTHGTKNCKKLGGGITNPAWEHACELHGTHGTQATGQVWFWTFQTAAMWHFELAYSLPPEAQVSGGRADRWMLNFKPWVVGKKNKNPKKRPTHRLEHHLILVVAAQGAVAVPAWESHAG